jgi:hypothetical protein
VSKYRKWEASQVASAPSQVTTQEMVTFETLRIVMLLMGYIVSLGTKCCCSRTPESETNVETVGLRTPNTLTKPDIDDAGE